MISRLQVQTLQIARRQVEKLSQGVFDESAWRIALRNVGKVKPDRTGHVSSKALDQAGFEAMMSFLEGMGYRRDSGNQTHWRNRNSQRTGFATTRQVYALRQLAAADSRYDLGAMCLRASNGRHDQPEKLTPGQARNLIEAYKSIAQRESTRAVESDH